MQSLSFLSKTVKSLLFFYCHIRKVLNFSRFALADTKIKLSWQKGVIRKADQTMFVYHALRQILASALCICLIRHEMPFMKSIFQILVRACAVKFYNFQCKWFLKIKLRIVTVKRTHGQVQSGDYTTWPWRQADGALKVRLICHGMCCWSFLPKTDMNVHDTYKEMFNFAWSEYEPYDYANTETLVEVTT